MDFKFLFLILVSIFILSCGQDDKKKALIQKEVAAGVEAFRSQRYKECLAMSLEKANVIADSLIQAKYAVTDSSALIGKPVKPDKIVIKTPLDTTPVKPILPK